MKHSHIFAATAVLASGLLLAGCSGTEPVIVTPTPVVTDTTTDETIDPGLDPISDAEVLTMQTEVELTGEMITTEAEFGTELDLLKELIQPVNSQPEVAQIVIVYNDDNTFTVTGTMLNRDDVEPFIVTGEL